MDKDEQEIRQLVKTWMEATQAGDADAVLDLMSDDVVFLVPGSPPFGKARFAEAAKSQTMKFEGKSEIQEIKVLGDWAFMWTRLSVVATPPQGGLSMIRSGHTLSILNKQNGKWMLTRDANLLAPVKQ